MRALFRHEFRSYIRSPASYAVAGLFIMVSSVYFTLDNMRGHSADLSSLYSAMSMLFLFIVPVLTSRTLAEDRRTGMDILYLTSPSGAAEIVAAKYLAAFALLVLVIALTLVFPIFMLLFTDLHILPLLGYYAGLLLLCAAITSLGVFISSLTESQVIASVTCFTVLLLMFVMRPIGAALGGTAARVFAFLSPFARYDEFGRGIFSLQGIIYFLSFTFLFIFLTFCSLSARNGDWSAGNGKRKDNSNNNSNSNNKDKGNCAGRAYALVSTISIIAIVILVNLIARFFPLKLDFSAGKRYSIGTATAEILARLDKDITIYGFFDKGKADRDYLEICTLLETYAARSAGHISVIYTDPDRDVLTLAALDPDGTMGLRRNDFYVTDGAPGKRIRYQDLTIMKYDQQTSVWFNVGSGAERAFSEAILSLAEQSAGCEVYTGSGYTLYSSGGYSELPVFISSYSGLLLDVQESSVIPLGFYGLFLPTAYGFDIPDGSEVLAAYSDGKALAAAWEHDGYRYALVGSSDYLSDTVRTDFPAYYVTNQYFEESLRDWVSAPLTQNLPDTKSYETGELQIPRIKADYIGFLTVIVLPLGVFLRGFLVWNRRRLL